jgi:Tfp pilus assembly protein PilF
MLGHLVQKPKVITGNFGTSRDLPSPRDVQTPNRRLDSWKEIATFFDRDERTVKRWEKERSLPIHRLPGGSRGRVFASTNELYAWMHSPESGAGELGAVNNCAEKAAATTTRTNGLTSPAVQLPNYASAAHDRSRRAWILAAAFLLLVAVAATALFVGYHRHAASLARENASAPRINPEAQELYLKGRYYWDKRTPADLTTAVDYFTQAIVHDPNYAQPYVGLADCYNLLREFAAMPSQEAFPRALAAAKKAVELDDSSAEAHASLAFVTFYWSWDSAAAEREFRRAIELNPNYVEAHHWYATFLLVLGRFPEALKEIDRAQQLDPSSTPILADKALILFHMERPDEAAALLKQIDASQPGFFSTHKYLSYIYLSRHDLKNYLAEARTAAALSHDERESAIVSAAEQGFKSGGEHGMLENMLKMQQKFYAEGEMSAFFVASTAARLGRKQEAMRYLQASYQQHDPYFLSIRIAESLTTLHDDANFRKLVEQAGLPPLP